MDSILRSELLALLESLVTVAHKHNEIFDTEVREMMFEAVHDGFLKPQPSFVLAKRSGMFSDEGNQEVREALGRYIECAGARATAIGMFDPNERLAAFQDEEVQADDHEGGTLEQEDFFGWAETI